MSDTEPSTETGRGEAQLEPVVSEAVRSTESYDTESGVVFYDAENPLAWIQADHVVDLDPSA